MISGTDHGSSNKRSSTQRILRLAAVIEDGLLVVMLVAMIVVAGTQILLRNVFETGLAWGDPLLRMMVLWVGLLGAMVATRKRNHISIDILSRYLPPAARRASDVLTDTFTGGVCALLAYQASRFVWQDYQAQVTAVAGLPAWLFELIIPLGFAVISVRYFLHVVDVLRGDGQ